MDDHETIRELARCCYNFSAAILMPNGKLRKMSDYDNIENDMDMEMNMDDLSLEMDENDVFEDNDEDDYGNELEDEDETHSDNEILDDDRQVLQAHIMDEEESATRDLLDNPIRRSNAIRQENSLADLLDQPECDDFTDSDDGERVAAHHEPPVEPLSPVQPQIRGQVQRITLRRHRDTGFGFRPAGCSNMTIVASVRAGSSAARHGLKMGDRIHSIITPKRNLQASDAASMLVEFRNGPQTLHQIHSVDQIKEVLGRCRSYVTLCIIRDMDQIDTDIEVEPLTPLGLGLQSTNLGIFVTSVQPGSVGDIFGYRFGDQILSINEHAVHTSDDIRRVRRKALREMEVRKAKKKSVGLFRSVSSLSTASRRQQADPEPDRPVLERIRLSVGRRSVDDYSNHPINEIWNENENRQSPTNILEPVFDESAVVQPTAPPNETSDEDQQNHETSHSTTEEKELIEALKASSITSKSPSRASSIKVTVPDTSDEPALFETRSPSTTAPIKKTPPKPSTSEIDTKCVICLEGTKDIVFLPCWHLVSCADCAVRLKECPLCREVIQVRRRPYRC